MPFTVENVVFPLCSDTKKAPLVSLACAEVEGKPLLEWTMQTLSSVGLNKFFVITGTEKNRLNDTLGTIISRNSDMEIMTVSSKHWTKGDGSALLEIEGQIGSNPFLLLNPANLISPELAEKLASWPMLENTQSATAVINLQKNEAGEFSSVTSQSSQTPIPAGNKSADNKTKEIQLITDLHVMTPEVFTTLKSLQNGKKLKIADAVQKMAQRNQSGFLWTDFRHVLPITDIRDLSKAPGFLSKTGMLAQKEEHGGVKDPKRVLSYIEGILNEKTGLHYTLMNPGPVLTTAKVKSAMVHHDICHRDEEFPKVVKRLRRKLKLVFGGGPEHEVLLITGSGTSGMEAAISSCIPDDKKLLVIANGAFGERFMEIAKQHRLNLETLHYKWGEQINPEDVRQALMRSEDIFAVAMCHHETSVGLINPIRAIGNVVREFDRLFIVDSVASLGAEPLNVRKDKIDVCVSSANKCLHSTSGVATVCVSHRAWLRMEDIHPRVYYLNLKRYRDYAKDKEETPFTPTVSGFFALDAAVDELLAEGVEGRAAVYKKRNDKIRNRIKSMGLDFLSSTGHESKTLTCVEVPQYINFNELYHEMKRRGYLIYNSKEHLKDKFFQIANMGDLTDETIEAFLTALEMVLMAAKSRIPVELKTNRFTARQAIRS